MRGLFVSVGGEPILSDLQGLKPSTGSLWAGRHPWHLDTCGIWTPVAFGHSDGCSARYCRQQHLGSQIPTITMGELGDPLFWELGTALGSMFGVQLVAAVESWGQEPLALTQPLF